VTGDVARRYAHTAEGALLAAVQIGVRYLVAPDWRAVVNVQVASGPGRDAYLALRQADPVGANATATPGGYLQIAGFEEVTYSPATAVVQLLSRGTGTYQVVTDTVVWQDGDWRLELQPDGSASPTAQQVGSAAGFIAFGGI